MSESWSGDWKTRLRERARRFGHPSIWRLAASRPDLPLGKVFELIRQAGEPDDAPLSYVQFQSVFFADSEAEGQLHAALMDTLVRRLRQLLSQGWNQGKRNREAEANVRSQWELPPERFEEFNPVADAVWRRLKETSLPDDWLPADRNDPVLQEVLARSWSAADE